MQYELDFVNKVPDSEGWFVAMDEFGRIRNLFVTWAYKPPIELTVQGIVPLDRFRWAVDSDGEFISSSDDY